MFLFLPDHIFKQSLGLYRNLHVRPSVSLSVCLSVYLSVRPSVCPSVHIVSGLLVLSPLTDLNYISHKYRPWPKRVSWPWTKFISARSRCTHTQTLCPGHCHAGSWEYITKLLSMIQGWVMTSTKGHIAKFKVTVHTYQNPCPGHNSSQPYWIWIIFHTTVIHGQRVCHHLDLGSFSNVKYKNDALSLWHQE